MKKGDYNINAIYQGGYSSLSSDYGDMFTGYRASAGDLALTTDPRTANLIKDASGKLASGIKHIELAIVTPEIFDSIPKDHLKEVHRLSKLTGTSVSVHGPVVDSAGMTQQGFSEINREASERRFIDVVERSHEVNPEGNGIVVFHSAEGIPGTEWETLGKDRKAKKLVAVNRESGQMIPLPEKIRYEPGEDLENVKPSSPEKELEVANRSEWGNNIDQLTFNKERADEILRQNEPQIREVLQNKSIRNERGEINQKLLTPTQRQALNYFQTAKGYLGDINKNLNALFSKAYEFGTPDQRKELIKVSEKFADNLQEENQDIMTQSRATHVLMNDLRRNDLTPQMYVPIEEFAVEKSSQTFGNTAYATYKKFGTKAPIIAIENPPAGFALSTGEDLKNLVVASREQFVRRAVEEGKLSKSQAEKEAEKLIGATWDVGHINMLKRQGFEDKDIVKETEKIAPYVKHIHLSDNFGFEHTELPMGMGNVPLKEMMEKLPEKDLKKVIEAGQWWQHMQKDPVRESLIGLGSPMYSTGTGPFWNQAVGLEQGYMSGMEGNWLPQINYETMGTGFARLPSELGGQRPGQGGRMSGNPME